MRSLIVASLIALAVVLGPAHADHSATHGKAEAAQECTKIIAARKRAGLSRTNAPDESICLVKKGACPKGYLTKRKYYEYRVCSTNRKEKG